MSWTLPCTLSSRLVRTSALICLLAWPISQGTANYAAVARSVEVRRAYAKDAVIDLEIYPLTDHRYVAAVLSWRHPDERFLSLRDFNTSREAEVHEATFGNPHSEITVLGCTEIRSFFTNTDLISALVGCQNSTPILTIGPSIHLIKEIEIPSLDAVLWVRPDGAISVVLAAPWGVVALAVRNDTNSPQEDLLPPGSHGRVPAALSLHHFLIAERNFVAVVPRERSISEVIIFAEGQDGKLRRFQGLSVDSAISVSHLSFSLPNESADSDVKEYYLLVTSYNPRRTEQKNVIFKFENESFVPFQLLSAPNISPFAIFTGKEAVLASVSKDGLVAFQFDGWRFAPSLMSHDPKLPEIAQMSGILVTKEPNETNYPQSDDEELGAHINQPEQDVQPVRGSMEENRPEVTQNAVSTTEGYDPKGTGANGISIDDFVDVDPDIDLRLGSASREPRLRVLASPGGFTLVILHETPQTEVDFFWPKFTSTNLSYKTYIDTRSWCDAAVRESVLARSLLSPPVVMPGPMDRSDRAIIDAIFRQMFAGAQAANPDDMTHPSQGRMSSHKKEEDSSGKVDDTSTENSSDYHLPYGPEDEIEYPFSHHSQTPLSLTATETTTDSSFSDPSCQLESLGWLDGVRQLVALDHMLVSITVDKRLEFITPVNGSFHQPTRRNISKIKDTIKHISQFSRIDLCSSKGFYFEATSDGQTVGQVYSVEEDVVRKLAGVVGDGKRVSVKGQCLRNNRQCFLLFPRKEGHCAIQCSGELTYFHCTPSYEGMVQIDNGLKEVKTTFEGINYRLATKDGSTVFCRYNKEGHAEKCDEFMEATNARELAMVQSNGKLVAVAVTPKGVVIKPEKGDSTTIDVLNARLQVYNYEDVTKSPIVAIFELAGVTLYSLEC